MAAEGRLSIYVTRDCPGCATAQRVAEEVRRLRPEVRVQVIELDDGGPLPLQVFGVPTYLWQGRVVSLGNPHVADLLAGLDASRAEGKSG